MNVAVIAHLCLSSVILTCLWLSLTFYQVQVDSFTASLKQSSACTEIYLAEMVFDREKCVFKTSSLIRVSTLCYNSYFNISCMIYACFWQNLTIQGKQTNIWGSTKSILCSNKAYKLTNCVILDNFGLGNPNLGRKQVKLICIMNVISDTLERSPLELPFYSSIQCLYIVKLKDLLDRVFLLCKLECNPPTFTMWRRYCYKSWPVHKYNKDSQDQVSKMYASFSLREIYRPATRRQQSK